ncbi:hypothetical protein [Chryseobacterium sp.]|uniref:hypothetical protein n=1 Tax=Chryseobacterium sp. TaxID=1871047 RepID=UPI0031DB8EF4
MKKVLLLSAFMVAGLVCAKESTSNKLESKKEKQQIAAFTRYLVTIKTIFGTTYQTVFDSEFDSSDCLYNEWEMYNNQDCGHSSYENPMT